MKHSIMKRRDFLRSAAALTAVSALPVVGTAALADAHEGSARDLGPPLGDGGVQGEAPAPISESERETRREKARRLMRKHGFGAMLIEPGANMSYFAGIEWERSERLFA